MSPSSSPSHQHACIPILGALLFLLVALPAAGQFRPTPGREYREVYNPVNPVSGEAVVGLAVAPTEMAQRAGMVQVFFDQPFSGEIQIETTTADGRFRGEGAYSGSTKGKEWVSLPIAASSSPDGKASPSRPVSATSLAIAARGPGGALYLVRWGDSPLSGTSNTLRLYVNSRRAEMFVRAGRRVERCATTGVTQPVRFDSYCDVPMTEVPRDGQLILIRRDQFDERTQPVIVKMP
jgi:hypothetical protein